MNEKLSILPSLATKEDIQPILEELNSLKEENRCLRNDIETLKKANLRNEKLVEDLELKFRSNNLIFRGLKSSDNEFNKTVVDFCQEILKVEINPNCINVLPLGPRDAANKPLLGNFLRHQDKTAIMGKLKMLKNTGFTVHQDFPESVRKKRSKLLLLKKEISRIKPSLRMTMRADTLILQGHKFNWCDITGLRSYSGEDGLKKLNDLLNWDLSQFVNALRSNSLPKDYFSSAQQPQHCGMADLPRLS